MLVSVFRENILMRFPVIAPQSFGWFLSPGINIPAEIFAGTEPGMSYSRTVSFVYMFVLAVTYIALGYIAFKHRKSESATKSAPSKLLHHVYRCLITLPIMLLCISTYVGVEEIVVCLVVALVVYFLYEIITTKKLRNLAKTIPAFLILTALCIVFAVTAGITGCVMTSHVPKVSSIESVVIQPNSRYDEYPQSYTDNLPGYNYLLARTAPIKNAEANEFLIKKGLVPYTEFLIGTEPVFYISQNDPESYPELEWHEPQLVTMNLKNGTRVTRNISLSPADWRTVYDANFVNVITKLPSGDEIVDISLADDSFFYGSFSPYDEVDLHSEINSSDEGRRIWELYREEAAGLGLNDFVLTAHVNYAVPPSAKTGVTRLGATIWVTGSVGSKKFRQGYDITSLTPRALEAYTGAFNTRTSTRVFRSEMDKARAELTGSSDRFYYMEITPYSSRHNNVPKDFIREYGYEPPLSYTVFAGADDDPDPTLKVLDYLKALEPKSVDGSQPYILVHWEKEDARPRRVFLPLTEEQLDELTNMLNTMDKQRTGW